MPSSSLISLFSINNLEEVLILKSEISFIASSLVFEWQHCFQRASTFFFASCFNWWNISLSGYLWADWVFEFAFFDNVVSLFPLYFFSVAHYLREEDLVLLFFFTNCSELTFFMFSKVLWLNMSPWRMSYSKSSFCPSWWSTLFSKILSCY